MYSRSSASMSLVWISALLLAGCSSPPAETPSSTPVESSSTPTPTEDPNAYQPATVDGPAKNVPIPEIPELAKQESAEGREAFMYYFFELMDYTIEARDPSELAKYTVKEAVYANNWAAISEMRAEQGAYSVGVLHKVTSVLLSPTADPNGGYSGIVTADLTELNAFKDGKPVGEFEPCNFWSCL